MKRLLAWLTLLSLAGATTARADEPTLKSYRSPDENRRDEPLAGKFSLAQAVDFLDVAALDWQKKRDCFSCHTNYAYLYARPMISAKAPAHTEIRLALEDLVTKRWPDKKPRWDAEVVATAAALAYNDAATTGKLHPVTRTALDRMWTVQQSDGGWRWLKCDWPPMELDDHYGVTLAAIAVGVAPDGYASTPAASKGMGRLRSYLKANPPLNIHHRAMLLWAASYTPDLVTDKRRKAYVKELLALQRPDGGWSAASLGQYVRDDGKEQTPDISDGYGTGLVVFVLRRAGVPASDPTLQRGLAWLRSHQRESGRWFTRSLFRDNMHYLTHAGTAFAVMALAACEEK
jgi:squalene-hopene/tetraprenyl-beta-curcumene cyclase